MLFIVFPRLVVLAGNASTLRQGETCGYRGTPRLDPGAEQESLRVPDAAQGGSRPPPVGRAAGPMRSVVDPPPAAGSPRYHHWITSGVRTRRRGGGDERVAAPAVMAGVVAARV
jgi:hypothetical protein